jgi:uncharacterized protein YegL
MKFRKLLTGAVVAFGMAVGGGAWANTIVNLGFAIDKSGSVSNSDFTLQQQGLAAALAQLVTDPASDAVSYNITVIAFGNDVTNLVSEQVVTAANIGTIQNNITSYVRNNTGSTQTGAAIDAMVASFSTNAIADTLTLFNISTDGEPCCQSGAQTIAETAATNAFAAGVDSISVELIGTFQQSQIDNMLAITGPNSIYVTSAALLPDPSKQGFVFGVANFDAYGAAIGSKVQQIVDPNVIPLPAGLPLLLAGLGAFALVRRRQAA